MYVYICLRVYLYMCISIYVDVSIHPMNVANYMFVHTHVYVRIYRQIRTIVVKLSRWIRSKTEKSYICSRIPWRCLCYYFQWIGLIFRILAEIGQRHRRTDPRPLRRSQDKIKVAQNRPKMLPRRPRQAQGIYIYIYIYIYARDGPCQRKPSPRQTPKWLPKMTSAAPAELPKSRPRAAQSRPRFHWDAEQNIARVCNFLWKVN